VTLSGFSSSHDIRDTDHGVARHFVDPTFGIIKNVLGSSTGPGTGDEKPKRKREQHREKWSFPRHADKKDLLGCLKIDIPTNLKKN
jgi:hypothetical protein|tara:strand:- start:309 stop:566 length:258 start_codon:yes stop_codon:yes gene_type:complete